METVVSIRLKGVARGMFPIGHVTELLYQAIDYLESHDTDGADLHSALPIRQNFRDGLTSMMTLEVEEVQSPEMEDQT